MKTYLLILANLLFIIIGHAHSPNASTTMLVEKSNGSWILQISSSLTAFQQEVRTHFTETPYKSPEEFQHMVLEHLKNNIDIDYNNGSSVKIGNGSVKLGHETKVIFEVFGIDENMKTLNMRNTAFNDITQSQSALFIFKNGFKKDQFILNNENEHSIALKVDDNKFVEIDKQKAGIDPWIVIFLLTGLLLIGLLTKRLNETNALYIPRKY